MIRAYIDEIYHFTRGDNNEYSVHVVVYSDGFICFSELVYPTGVSDTLITRFINEAYNAAVEEQSKLSYGDNTYVS